VENFQIEISSREQGSTSANNRLRKEGKIPAIVYHRGENSVPGAVSYKEFVRLAQMAKTSQVFTLKSEAPEFNGRSALVRDIQKDYLSGKVIHIDFQALKEDEEIRVTVGIKYLGDAVGVKTEGGMLSIHTHELTVSCLPKDIPLVIEVDISALKLNQHFHASDIELPNGVNLLPGKEEEPLISVVAMKEETVAAAAGDAAAAPATDAKAAAPAAAAAKGGAKK
jgi:large subunit ribosomal protein L25